MDAQPYHLCLETLSNELRLKSLELLRQKPMSVTELANSLGVERSRLSHSLAMLKLCKIADAKREGKEIIYSLNANAWPMKSPRGSSVFMAIDKHISTHCGSCAKRTGKGVSA